MADNNILWVPDRDVRVWVMSHNPEWQSCPLIGQLDWMESSDWLTETWESEWWAGLNLGTNCPALIHLTSCLSRSHPRRWSHLYLVIRVNDNPARWLVSWLEWRALIGCWGGLRGPWPMASVIMPHSPGQGTVCSPDDVAMEATLANFSGNHLSTAALIIFRSTDECSMNI